jgi:hypothetical protein
VAVEATLAQKQLRLVMRLSVPVFAFALCEAFRCAVSSFAELGELAGLSRLEQVSLVLRQPLVSGSTLALRGRVMLVVSTPVTDSLDLSAYTCPAPR